MIEEEFERMVADPKTSRMDLARKYRETVERAECEVLRVDWPRINRVILTRYKPSGLEHIKQLAWGRRAG